MAGRATGSSGSRDVNFSVEERSVTREKAIEEYVEKAQSGWRTKISTQNLFAAAWKRKDRKKIIELAKEEHKKVTTAVDMEVMTKPRKCWTTQKYVNIAEKIIRERDCVLLFGNHIEDELLAASAGWQMFGLKNFKLMKWVEQRKNGLTGRDQRTLNVCLQLEDKHDMRDDGWSCWKRNDYDCDFTSVAMTYNGAWVQFPVAEDFPSQSIYVPYEQRTAEENNQVGQAMNAVDVGYSMLNQKAWNNHPHKVNCLKTEAIGTYEDVIFKYLERLVAVRIQMMQDAVVKHELLSRAFPVQFLLFSPMPRYHLDALNPIEEEHINVKQADWTKFSQLHVHDLRYGTHWFSGGTHPKHLAWRVTNMELRNQVTSSRPVSSWVVESDFTFSISKVQRKMRDDKLFNYLICEKGSETSGVPVMTSVVFDSAKECYPNNYCMAFAELTSDGEISILLDVWASKFSGTEGLTYFYCSLEETAVLSNLTPAEILEFDLMHMMNVIQTSPGTPIMYVRHKTTMIEDFYKEISIGATLWPGMKFDTGRKMKAKQLGKLMIAPVWGEETIRVTPTQYNIDTEYNLKCPSSLALITAVGQNSGSFLLY